MADRLVLLLIYRITVSIPNPYQKMRDVLLSIAIFVTHFDPDIIVSTISEILLNCRATNLGFGSKRIDRIGKIVSLQTKFEICMPHCLTIVSVL